MSTTKPDAAGSAPQNAAWTADDKEFSVLEMLLVLWEYKRLLIASTLGAAIVAAGVTLLMPNFYTATARIVPPQQNNSSATALLGQLGGLAAAAGGSIAGIRNPNDLYVGIMKSRTVADQLIERFNLKGYFNEKSQNLTQQKLASATKISAGKDGIISVAVELKDPKLAAEVSNAYVEELKRLTGLLAVTEASQRRLFFERQLLKVRENLAVAETAARDALSKGGLALVEGQGRSLIESSARLRAQITSREVQVGAMRAFAADTNPDLQLIQRELGALRAELARLEGDTAQGPSAKPSPVASDNVRKLRELRYLETLQELLVRQTEAARLDEARDLSSVQILDEAAPPDHKSSPKRAFFVLFTSVIAFCAMVCFVFVYRATRVRHVPFV